MALIHCKECGTEFSDLASACPKCACQIEIEKNDKNTFDDISLIELHAKKPKNLFLQNIKYILLIIFIIIVILVYYIVNNNSNNGNKNENIYDKIDDTNEIDTLCIYNAYDYDKKTDGYTQIFLKGNSQKINIKVEENRERIAISYNCKTLQSDIYDKYHITPFCSVNSYTATNGDRYYSYKLEYNNILKQNIIEKATELKQQGYECITYHNTENNINNNKIVGSWCGYYPTLKMSEKIIFYENGTGKYIADETIEREFYYEMDNENIIRYTGSAKNAFLKKAYNETENLIYDGMRVYDNGEIIQDKTINYTFSRCD